MKYIDKFLNINKDEKEYRDVKFRIDIEESKIDSVEREIKDIENRIERVKRGINEAL